MKNPVGRFHVITHRAKTQFHPYKIQKQNVKLKYFDTLPKDLGRLEPLLQPKEKEQKMRAEALVYPRLGCSTKNKKSKH
ncbi:hypothetical protein CVV26_01180 [Candidatus Kuenenbacteria bacterium HGW-Kuenenbacteria-1]|uniref:Uncharacterized protein n=1 Tax=Candidatus Kuenenbacteria bacterium HGW-Kuenenbacteria-1 TaxID=2013812 RepID=A0A2N1UP16_9BACT|nr:MAG: hypothetical protein CVV26_01180 [Candidatus Kuenenbacteria bacterium HGW-Kuenenbacteria-1]